MSEGTADRQLRDRAGAVIPGGMYGHQAAPGAAYPQFMRGGRGAGLGRGRERVRRPDVQLRPGRARPPAPGRRGGRRGTGFRLHLGSSWEPVGVDPDLSAWSKAIANSRALAAVLGRDAFRDGAKRVFVTGSFWFSAVPMAAAVATIGALREEGAIEKMHHQGEALPRVGQGARLRPDAGRAVVLRRPALAAQEGHGRSQAGRGPGRPARGRVTGICRAREPYYRTAWVPALLEKTLLARTASNRHRSCRAAGSPRRARSSCPAATGPASRPAGTDRWTGARNRPGSRAAAAG